jgi:hypothetical protein
MSERQRAAARRTGAENRKLKRGIFSPQFDRESDGRPAGFASLKTGKGIHDPTQMWSVFGCHLRWHIARGFVNSMCLFCRRDMYPDDLRDSVPRQMSRTSSTDSSGGVKKDGRKQ